MKNLILALSFTLTLNAHAYSDKAIEAFIFGAFSVLSVGTSGDLSATTKDNKNRSKVEKLKENIVESKSDSVKFLETGVKTERLNNIITEVKELNSDLESVSDEELALAFLEVGIAE